METIYHIDINADLGEGAGNDARLMPLLSSCSIACGGHFGNIDTIKTAVSLAKKYGVKVGAHPSFPDTDNFGRELLTMTKSELTASIASQLQLFYSVCETLEAEVNHVKLHGALYNYAAKDAPTADAVIEAILGSGLRPRLYVPFGSVLHGKADNLLPLVFEAFIDRRYQADGSLVSRKAPNALIENPLEAWEQLREMVVTKSVKSVDGTQLNINASTYCIHGDHEYSLEILGYIHEQIKKHKISLK